MECHNCDTKVKRSEFSLGLSLNFLDAPFNFPTPLNSPEINANVTNQIITIENLIDQNLISEILEATCSSSKCQSRQTFTKQLKISGIQMPDYLIINLVRFQRENDTTKKIMTPVNCKSVVNLNEVIYACSSIIVHQGTQVNSGHYFAYVKTHRPEPELAWACLNDQVTSYIAFGDIAFQSDQTPYILIFQKTN